MFFISYINLRKLAGKRQNISHFKFHYSPNFCGVYSNFNSFIYNQYESGLIFTLLIRIFSKFETIEVRLYSTKSWFVVKICFKTILWSLYQNIQKRQWIVNFFLIGKFNFFMFRIWIICKFFKIIRWTNYGKYVIYISSVIYRFRIFRTIIEWCLFMKT